MPGKCLLFFKRSCPNYFDDIQSVKQKEMQLGEAKAHLKDKPWHLEFLVSLDENGGRLKKLCNEGGEDIAEVLAFIKSDYHLLQNVKIIVRKYSKKRYEKYFGRMSQQNSKLQQPSDSLGNESQFDQIRRYLKQDDPYSITAALDEANSIVDKSMRGEAYHLIDKFRESKKKNRKRGNVDRGATDMSDEGKADPTVKKNNNNLDVLGFEVRTTNVPVSTLPNNIVQEIQCISDICINGLPFVDRVANDAGTQFVLDHIGINIEEYRNYMIKIMNEIRQITIGWGGMVLNSIDQGTIFEYRAGRLPTYPNYLTTADGPIAGVVRGDRLIFAQDVEENSEDVILFIPKRDIANFPGVYAKDVFPTNYSTLQKRECIYIYTGLAENPTYWSYTELITTIYDLTINLYHLISENSSLYFDNTMSESHLTIIIGDNDASKFNMFAILSKVNPLDVRERY